jgi:hypothetical protein
VWGLCKARVQKEGIKKMESNHLPPFKTSTILWMVIVSAVLYQSCAANDNKTESAAQGEKIREAAQIFTGTTIDVDISNQNCLAIVLAKDGAISRKGTAAPDSADKDFFAGFTKDPVFDSLINKLSNELVEYSNTTSPSCDTTKPTCTARISFGNHQLAKSFEYCVNGTFNDLPAPIKNYITAAIRLTEPWYQNQRKLLKAK